MSSSKQMPLLLIVLILLCLFQVYPLPLSNARENPNSAELDKDQVVIDFNNVDITVFLKFISELTGKNFVVDSKVRGNVTIISPAKISTREAYRVFESVLDIHGYSAIESGEIVKIIPSMEAKSQNIDTRVSIKPERPEDRIVTRIIPLKFADSDEIKTLFTPLVSKGSVILSYGDTNMLILTDTLANIERLIKIIKAVDVNGIGKRISVISLEHADAEKLVKNLNTIFNAELKTKRGKPDGGDITKFVADERTNAIIMLASEIETDRVKQLIALLDKKVPKGEERIRVYYLEHASAENMAAVLQEIPTKTSSDTTGPGKKLEPLLSDKIRITADKSTNSLIIMADKEDYPVLEEVIKKLDIPRAMVYIECLIMEVNITRGLDIGTEWRAGDSYDSDSSGTDQGVYFGGSSGDGFSNINSLLTYGTLPNGFSLGVIGEVLTIGDITFPSLAAVAQFYQSDKNVNILSNPQILTTDNEEATLTIGKNVPYQTRSAAENATDTYSSYEYKDVGITLKITPQISQEKLVRLNIYQEVTKLDSVSQTSEDRPTTLKRLIETTLIVEDGNTVVIGGLIDESLSEAEYGAPCLGDIPGLGYLFKVESKGQEKTNLYMFLTPKVVKNPLDIQKIYEQKIQDMDTIKNGDVKLYKGLEIFK